MIGHERISTGWRYSDVGGLDRSADPFNEKFKLIYSGQRESSIDVVLIPDEQTYNENTWYANNPTFNTHVLLILKKLYEWNTIARRQYLFNFWISRTPGIAEGGGFDFDTANSCNTYGGYAWDREYKTFAELGLVIHDRASEPWRDCTNYHKKLASASPHDYNANHEFGHLPFGLTEEYDAGSFSFSGFTWYWDNDHMTNAFETPSQCENDAISEGKDPSDCREIDTSIQSNYYTYDPAQFDIMGDPNADYADLHFLDERRVNWVLDTLLSNRDINLFERESSLLQLSQYPEDISLPILPEQENATTIMKLEIFMTDDGTVNHVGTNFFKGFLSTKIGNPDLFRMKLFSSNHTVLSEYNEWNPLLIEVINESMYLLPNVTAEFLLPYYDFFYTMEIYDEMQSKTIITIDLFAAIREYEEAGTEERSSNDLESWEPTDNYEPLIDCSQYLLQDVVTPWDRETSSNIITETSRVIIGGTFAIVVLALRVVRRTSPPSISQSKMDGTLKD